LLDGFRLPFTKVGSPSKNALIPFDELPGSVISVALPTFTFFDGVIRGTPDPDYGFASSTIRGINTRIAVDAMGENRFPFVNSAFFNGLTADEVETITGQAIEQAVKTRAAIRQPVGSFAEVNVTVVDIDGTVLGYMGTPDAPFFGFDVSAQKARTAAFFSSQGARTMLEIVSIEDSSVDLMQYLNNATDDGLALDGSIAFSDRGAGFLNRPFLPDGIDGTQPGPFSKDLDIWSPFNDGLQLDLDRDSLFQILSGNVAPGLGTCTGISGLENGIQIFAGSVPLYKNGALVGGIGVSGDGIDQDDLVSAMGSVGFEAPPRDTLGHDIRSRCKASFCEVPKKS